MSDSTPAAIHRGKLGLMGHLGLRYVGGRELALVLHNEKFHKIQGGPGTFWVIPGVQRVAQVLTIGPDYVVLPLREIQTNDGVQVGFDVAIEYMFDPRQAVVKAEPERGKLFRRFPNQSDRREALLTVSQRAMQTAASAFRVDRIARNQVINDLEARFMEDLGRRALPLGISLETTRCAILKTVLPETIQQRLEISAQRAINIDNLSAYDPFHINQALRSEAVEALKGMQSATPYINLHDPTGGPDEDGSQPASKRTIAGELGPAPDPAPPHNTPEKPSKPAGKPFRSRLDPD
jgi:regulator of protease activity HflC (stomatin/prohibitin superfamily)